LWSFCLQPELSRPARQQKSASQILVEMFKQQLEEQKDEDVNQKPEESHSEEKPK